LARHRSVDAPAMSLITMQWSCIMTPADISQFPEFRQIPLTKGYYAIVDAENYEWLMQWKWHVLAGKHTFYAARSTRRINGRKTIVLMHRAIMSTGKGMQADHKDGNGLMNCWDNLRVCTFTQNNRNVRPQKNTSSRYRGVCWNKRENKWNARINVDGKQIDLGHFISEHEAALVYNKAAIIHYGEFAKLKAE
jgi:hypothetical protein